METKNKNAKEALLAFIERSEMGKNQKEYVQSDIVKITKWNADQFGWPVTWNGCKETSCIYGVRRDGLGLTLGGCRHADGKKTILYTNDPYIRSWRMKKLKPKEDSK